MSLRLLTGISELVTCGGERGDGALAALGIIEDAALLIDSGRVAWAGPEAALPPERAQGAERHDLGGRLVTPGFVDPHTHLAFAGDRSAELAARLEGASYLEILQAGGGIHATVAATRAASEDALAERCALRLARLGAQGITTVEVKSGYGLSVDEELKLLRAIARAAAQSPLRVVSTLLGAHALPAELHGQRARYVESVCEEMIPAAAEAGLASHVDIFVEEGAFTAADAAQVAKAAQRWGLGLRMHVDQLSAGGGAELAVDLEALSADHLEQVSPAGIAALARSGCAAGLLPTATLYARLPSYAPGRALADAGATLSLGTNWNPGSAHSENHALALGLACLRGGLSPAEALLAATDGAARSLGLSPELGRLSPGARADLVVHEAETHAHLVYHFAVPHARWVLAGGTPLSPSPWGAAPPPPRCGG